MVKVLHKYVHEYDFPYSNILLNYKTEILKFYQSQHQLNKNITDINLPQDHPLTKTLTPKLNQVVQTHFWVGDPQMDYGLRTYIQNNTNNSSFYHIHQSPSSISGVFYLDIPKEGGELSFLLNPDGIENKEIIIKPQIDKLYLFPYWIYHKPLPQKDSMPRICFNWLYGSTIRPIHKATTIQW